MANGNTFDKLTSVSGFMENKMSILKEFRDFAMRGNVVDLAVGVIIGAAFGKLYRHWLPILLCRHLAC